MTTRFILIAFLAAAALSTPAFAGPPFLTDDPDPVPYHHWEFYTFSSGDRTRGSNSVSGPAIELNNGVAPNVQLHLVVPYAYASSGGTSASGLGDTEAGVKYRFLDETKSRPEVGTFPQLELPTGDQSRGLGNGRTWVKVPLWLQKSWGSWTTYGGVGRAFNNAPGQRDYYYGGDLIQKSITSSLTLGGELFLQGATTDAAPAGQPYVTGSRSTAIVNLGGQYNFTPDFSLLFSGGHSVQGEGQTIYYLALYRTWGPGAP